MTDLFNGEIPQEEKKEEVVVNSTNENNLEKKDTPEVPEPRKVYKIVSVFLKNFMGVPTGTFKFDAKSVFLCAKNARGKTDLMTAVISALRNEKIDMPIKAGEREANNIITLQGSDGEIYTIEVFYTSDGEEQGQYFEIKAPDGKKYHQVKSLTSLVGGSIGFDADKFVRDTATAEGMRKNVAMIKRYLGEEKCKQIADLDAKVLKTKADREVLNTRIIELRTLHKKVSYNEQEIYEYREKKDSVKLNEEYAIALNASTANVQNEKDLEAKKTSITGIEKDIKDIDIEIASIEKQLEEKKKKRTEKNDALKVANEEKEAIEKKIEEVSAKKEGRSATEIQAEIKTIDDFNKKVDDIKKFVDERDEFTKKEKEWKQLGEKYIEYDAEKGKVMSESKLPVKGLTFDENGIYIKLDKNPEPIPITQLSTAERTKMIAVPLAIAEDPKVRIIHVGNAESMDFDTLKEIQDYADANDYQVFYEEVDRTAEEIIVRFSEDVIVDPKNK